MTATTDYRPRHSWEKVRLSTSQGQLQARMAVIEAVGDPTSTEYAGRHRLENSTVSRLVRQARVIAEYGERLAQVVSS